MTKLSNAQLDSIKVGEAVTAGAVASIIAIAIAAVIAYKLFTSKKGTTKLPGGFNFNWD